jgi:uncharacterized protein YbjQ (UPF0145 family)
VKNIIVVNDNAVAGYRIVESLGLVRGNTVRARHLGRDITALFRNIVGGEVPEYRKLMAESREQSLDQMVDEARELGADAVIMVRFSTSMIGAGLAEILAYGTAVRLESETGG